MKRILIVEDSSDILFVLKTELEWQGFQVDITRDAQSGLDLARLTRPDVIFTDIRMPGADGFEFLRTIRLSNEFAHTPVIALTGCSTSDEIQELLACGFAACVTKPVEIADLVILIHKVTAKRFRRKAG